MLSSSLPPALARSRWKPTAAERRRLLRESAHFEKVRRAEDRYATQLRRVARHVADFVTSFDVGSVDSLDELRWMLERYAETLKPWAYAAAQRMLADVSRRDAAAWFKTAREIGASLTNEINEAPIGFAARNILEEQVHLITSIPIEAGRRVQKAVLDFVAGGKRYDDLVDFVERTGTVTRNRATLIARTEVAKAQSAITQARAQYVGSEQFIWRTARDSHVRMMHKRLEGKVFSWDDPPVAEEGGERHLPGNFPRCRCWAEPILPDVIR